MEQANSKCRQRVRILQKDGFRYVFALSLRYVSFYLHVSSAEEMGLP